jgi:hypothetical protein
MTEIKTNQINVFVLGSNQTAIPGAKVVAYDGEEGIGGAIMGGSAFAPARITLSEEYKSVKLVASVGGHGSKEATVNADVGNYYFEFEDVGPADDSTHTPVPQSRDPIGGSMSTQTRASWIFGGLFVVFVLGVFMFGPATLPDYKQRILAYVCALLAGLFALFFTGTLLLNAELPIAGKWAVQGGAGFALFLVVLFWWSGALAPVKSEKTDSAVVKPDASSNAAAHTSPTVQSVSRTKDVSTGQVNFGCQQTLNVETPEIEFGPNPRNIDAKTEWVSMDNHVKSYAASTKDVLDPASQRRLGIEGVGTITGLDRDIVKNCPGGGHGTLTLHASWVEDQASSP